MGVPPTTHPTMNGLSCGYHVHLSCVECASPGLGLGLGLSVQYMGVCLSWVRVRVRVRVRVECAVHGSVPLLG